MSTEKSFKNTKSSSESKSKIKKPRAEKVQSSPNKNKKTKGMDYSRFLNLPHNEFYFFDKKSEIYLAMAPGIRSVLLQVLSDRPLDHWEVSRILRKINADYPMALDYLVGRAANPAAMDYDSCLRAVQNLTDGIEVRFVGDKDYWGLSSKFDSV